MENIYKKVEKDHFLSLVEKTLRIQNEGGSFFMRNKKVKVGDKKITVQEKILKTPGGVFFSLVKKECNFTKEETKLIFCTEKALEKERNRLIKDIQKILI
jgi:hypothetical protein